MRNHFEKRAGMWLALIVVLGAALRLGALGSTPNGVYIDEASLGYNAWAVATTGADENGERWPIYPRSLGGGKNPVYFYAAVASTALLGLSPFSIRLPAAIFGVLTILAVYQLCETLFKDKPTSLLAALFLCLSPWHFHFSRVAFEAISLPLFITLGVREMWVGRHAKGALPRGAIWLGLSVYCYAVGAVWSVAFFAFYTVAFRGQLKKHPAMWALAAVLLALMIAPQFGGVKGTEGQRAYFDRVSLLSPAVQASLREKQSQSPSALARAASRTAAGAAAHQFASAYLSHFSFDFLFRNGDQSSVRHHPPYGGQVPLAYLPALLFALWLVFRKGDPARKLLLCWLIAAPIPDSLTVEGGPHAIRSIVFLPLIQIMAAYAVGRLIYYLSLDLQPKLSRNVRRTILPILGAFFAALLIQEGAFFNYYFRDYPNDLKSAVEWKAGFAEAIHYIEANKADCDGVLVSSSIPYVYSLILFHGRIDPKVFRSAGFEKPELGRSPKGSFEKYSVRPLNAIRKTGKYFVLKRPGDAMKASSLGETKLAKTVFLEGAEKGYPLLEIYEVAAGRAAQHSPGLRDVPERGRSGKANKINGMHDYE